MDRDIQLIRLVTYLMLTSFLLPEIDGGRPSRQQLGCTRRGLYKLIEVDGCRSHTVLINVCQGYCLSYSYPSEYERYLISNGRHRTTSAGTCCSISRTHDVLVILNCVNNQQRSITVQSAATCSCSLCEY